MARSLMTESADFVWFAVVKCDTASWLNRCTGVSASSIISEKILVPHRQL